MNQRDMRRAIKIGAFVVAIAGLWVVSGWGHWGVALGSGRAQSGQAAAVKSPVPDLSGFWEIKDKTGAGLRGGAVIGHPDPPVLTDEAKAAQAAQRRSAEGGQTVSVNSQYCRTLAYPFFMTSSPPFDIIQGPNEVMVMAEREMGSRHIFLNQEHPDPAHLEYTDNGDSIGHWEGDTLVVDTIGFRPGNGGGGMRSKEAHLVERYKLIDNGNRLSVSFIWTDPQVYAKPYSYELGYYRSEPSQYAMEDWCDASDALQARSDGTPLTVTKKKDSK